MIDHTIFGCSEKVFRKAAAIVEEAGRAKGVNVWGLSPQFQRAVLRPIIETKKIMTHLAKTHGSTIGPNSVED